MQYSQNVCLKFGIMICQIIYICLKSLSCTCDFLLMGCGEVLIFKMSECKNIDRFESNHKCGKDMITSALFEVLPVSI